MAASKLKLRLDEEIKQALKAGDKVRLGALRMLSAALTNREKDVLHDLTDEQVQEMATREVKRRTESIEAFEQAGRDDLVTKEREEREVLAAYAPEQLSEAEVDAIVDEAIAATGATSVKEMGAVMGAVMAKAKGKVDGKVVQAKVKSKLAD
ncbi:MAG: GatB/YqeY domain-containing protein [Actinomycetota bacterium]